MTMSDVDAGPDAPPDARRRPPWVVVIALVAVLAVVAVLVSRCASGGGDGATPVPSTLDAPTATAIGDAVTKAVEAQSQVVAEVYRRIQPSVVEIDVEQSATVTTADAESAGLGTGVIVNADGTILTAFHVVAHATSINVVYADGTRTHRRRSSPPTRSTTSPPLQPATLPSWSCRRSSAAPASASALPVVAVGNPLGLTTPPRPAWSRRWTARYRPTTAPSLRRADPVRRRGQPGQLRRTAGQRARARRSASSSRWPTRPTAGTFIGIGFAVPIGTAVGPAAAASRRSDHRRTAADGPTTDDRMWRTAGVERPRQRSAQPRTRWSRCSTRSRRPSSARTCCSSGCWSRCWPAGTSSSRACPAWPRRWPSSRSPRRSAGSSTGSSSRPTWCRPTSSAPGSTTSSSGEFQVSLGPVFTNLLLADEINRAPAKVQSALLEVMQEQQVTIGRETHHVPRPFLVMATQNPIESEGTYPLPEAQVDRFMMKVLVGYPSADRGVRDRRAGHLARRRPARRIIDPELLIADAGRRSSEVYVDPALIEYSVRLANATRDPAEVGLGDLARYVSFGASPRASINLILGRPGAGLRPRPRLRPAARRHRAGARRAPAPPGALLRGAVRRRSPPTPC